MLHHEVFFKQLSLSNETHYMQHQELIFDLHKCKKESKLDCLNMQNDKSKAIKEMDWRIIVVFTPIALAISWAGYNIGRAALAQLQLAINNFKKNQS